MITLMYFAQLREQLGLEQEQIDLPENAKTIADLRVYLAQRSDVFEQAFNSDQRLLSAINQVMSKGHAEITDGDEIAFFPPVTGG